MELILLIVALVIVIMAWSKISKGLDWMGARVGETGDMLSDVTVSGAKQTARGVLISHGSLKDTADEQVQKDITRARAMTTFKEGLSAAEKTTVKESEDYYKTLLNR